MSARKTGGGKKNFGGEQIIEPSTMRGQSWPCLRQFAVFMENRVGRLHDLLRKFEGPDTRVIALSIANSVDCAFVRLMVSNSDRGREILQLSQFSFSENDIIGVELPDGSQPFLQICMALLQAELNVHYTYPLLYQRHGRGAIALYVDDIDLALRTLTEKRLRVITEHDLMEEDDIY